MIIKKRYEPVPLTKLKAVLPRLPRQFSSLPKIESDIAIRTKGHIGEKKVDYFVEQLPAPFTILHDVYLKNGQDTCQIDSLIMSNHAIYLIETKNFNGTITFNTTLKQFTRRNGESETGFRYPLTQVETTKFKMTKWLHANNLHNIPVHTFIAISEPSTIIKVDGNEKEIAKVVTHAEYLPQKIIQMDTNIRKTSNNQLYQQKIAELLLKECKEFDFDILRTHHIQPSHITPGVICPYCEQLAMRRNKHKW